MTARARVWYLGVAALAAIVALADPAGAQTEAPRLPAANVTTDRIVLGGALPGLIDAPQSLAVTPNAVWIVYHRAGRVDRLDPDTHELVASVDVKVPGCLTGTGCSGLEQIAADERNVWVVDYLQGSVVHIDARTNRVVGSVPTGGTLSTTLVLDGDSVWAALSGSGDVYRISAGTTEVTKRVRVDDAPAWPLAIVDDVLWAGSYDRGAPDGQAAKLHRIDRRRGKVTRTVSGVTGSEGHVIDGDLWISGCNFLGFPALVAGCPSISRVDGRTGVLEAAIPLGGHPFAASRGGSHAPAVHVDNGPRSPLSLTTIDTRRNLPTAVYDLPPAEYPGGLAFGHGSLWLTNWTENTVSRLRLPEEPAESPSSDAVDQ